MFHRRTFNEQVLHIVKDEGTFSTMHTLMIYLQTALQDQCPVVAGLLLQLDLLVRISLSLPRRYSVLLEYYMALLQSNGDVPGRIHGQSIKNESLLILALITGSGVRLVSHMVLKEY